MTPGQGEKALDELQRADQALRAARLLLGADAPEDATSRLYYAVFHAARAALTVQGRYARTHSGQITLFSELMGPAPILGRLFTLRGYADYSTERFPAPADLGDVVEEAAALVHRCRALVDEAREAGPDEPDPPPDY